MMMMMDSRNFGCCNKETKTDDNSFNALINYQLNSVFKLTGKPTHEVFVRVGNFVVALTVFKKKHHYEVEKQDRKRHCFNNFGPPENSLWEY